MRRVKRKLRTRIANYEQMKEKETEKKIVLKYVKKIVKNKL